MPPVVYAGIYVSMLHECVSEVSVLSRTTTTNFQANYFAINEMLLIKNNFLLEKEWRL